MSCTGVAASLRRLAVDASRSREVPAFLLPSISRTYPSRNFSTSRVSKSRIGSAPISIPPDVSLRFFDLPKENARSRKADSPTTALEITGPLGQLTVALPPYIVTKHDEAGKRITVRVENSEEKHQRSMWGTMRAHVANSISGVSEGHICILRLVGVGYRATVEESATTISPTYPGQKFVNLKLGYAHPVELGVPAGVKASVPQPTRILLEGCDKQTVTQFAAEIRAWRVPEPYKGKGIFVNDETIRLKSKSVKS